MLGYFALVFLFVLSFSTNALEFITHKTEKHALVIQMDEFDIRIKPLSTDAVEVHYLIDNGFPSFALAPSHNEAKITPKVTETEHSLMFTMNKTRVVMNKVAHTLSFFRGEQLLLRHQISSQSSPAIDFAFDISKDQILMGAGERVLGMDRRGHKLPLYNRAHYGYTDYSEQMNYSMPAIVSNKKYNLLFDNTAKGWLDLAKTQSDTIGFSAVGGRAAFVVTSADTYPELIHHYVDITGKQPMPARWVFGNHASRFGYKSQEQVLDTIKKYRNSDIPVDSVILDLYWFGKDVQGHMGNLQWDLEAFPAPEAMINELANMGVNTTLITEPFVLKKAKRHQQALDAGALALNGKGDEVKYYDFYFGHTALVDVFSQSGQDWFASVYNELAQQGIIGVWGDLGEPEVHPEDMQHNLSKYNLIASADEIHNAYGHQWAHLVQHTLTQLNPEIRPFILMRSGFAGSQRFGLIPWTGDVSRSWGGLKPQVELSLQMGILGLAYTHSDLGGFAGDDYDKEMYIRWLQYGVFQPVYRPHAQDKVPSEPVFHDEETQRIVREYIKLRYALLPYNYSLAYENATTGMPLMRPMFFTDESVADLIAMKDQYMWGDSFLVKPITEPNIKSTKVWLPTGTWFDYWTDEKYVGGTEVEVPVDLTKLPVLVKAGAIIPSVEPVSTTAQYSSRNLNLDYYFSSQIRTSQAQMYEDDGKSAKAMANQQFELLHFYSEVTGSKAAKDEVKLTLKREVKGEYQGIPEYRTVTVSVHNWHRVATLVKLADERITEAPNLRVFNQLSQASYYDVEQKTLRIKLPWRKEREVITLY